MLMSCKCCNQDPLLSNGAMDPHYLLNCCYYQHQNDPWLRLTGFTNAPVILNLPPWSVVSRPVATSIDFLAVVVPPTVAKFLSETVSSTYDTFPLSFFLPILSCPLGGSGGNKDKTSVSDSE